jgi:predicted ATPase
MQGQEIEGINQMRQGLRSLRATGTELGLPGFLIQLAEGYWKNGQPEMGLAVLAESLDLVDKLGVHCWEAEQYRLKGELLLALSSEHHIAAEACFRRAIKIADRQQVKSLELRAALSLSRLWQRQRKQAEARHVLAEIYHWFTEGSDTNDLKDAEALLRTWA